MALKVYPVVNDKHYSHAAMVGRPAISWDLHFLLGECAGITPEGGWQASWVSWAE
jgi:hypothetical protein